MSMQIRRNAIRILLVEDNPDDVAITRRALSKGGLDDVLIVAQDGQQALDMLRRKGDYAGASAVPFPDLILLDLNLPRGDGREVLREVKEDLTLRRIPIIVLTTSQRDEDIVTPTAWESTPTSGNRSILTVFKRWCKHFIITG